MRKIIFLALLTISICFESIAQNKRLITGNVTDLGNGNALPYASISLKTQLIGTITNEKGEFGFLIPENIVNDTLIASYLGYQDQKIFVGAIRNQVSIKLQTNSFPLQEVTVRPMPPTHYIKLSVNKITKNYPNTPFTTEAYFSVKVLENKLFIQHNEAVFKTYYPAYMDTIAPQNQLLLYREENKVQQVAFMRAKRDKQKEKEKIKAIKNGLEYTENEAESMIILKRYFSRPKLILKVWKIDSTEPYLDSTSFKKFHYSFNENSTLDIMAINFKAKKAINKVRLNGNIFIDMQTDAIVAIETYGTIKLPLVFKPIFFLLGISIDNPNILVKRNYRQIQNKWYPSNIQLAINLMVTKKYILKKNEYSNFEINQVFSVNKLELDNPTQISLGKRFNSKNEFKTQVFNDNGILWSEINIIK